MILTFLLPLIVWPRSSFSATYSLESWSESDPVGEVAPMGVPVIVATLFMSGNVVLVAFLGILYSNLRSSISLVKLAVLATAVFVLNVVSFVVAALVSIVVFFPVKSVFVAMRLAGALASIVGSFVVMSVVVATAAPVSIVASFVVAALVLSIVESFSVKSVVVRN